jgi:hypothetical protein
MGGKRTLNDGVVICPMLLFLMTGNGADDVAELCAVDVSFE